MGLTALSIRPRAFCINTPAPTPHENRELKGSRFVMVRVYYHDNLDTDPRLPHVGEPAPISAVEELGIHANHYEDIAEVNELAEGRGYMNRDEVETYPGV